MWDQKERLLAGMFVAQLVAATVLGLVLVSALGGDTTEFRPVVAEGPLAEGGDAVPAPGSPSGGSATTGGATGGTTAPGTTTTSGGLTTAPGAQPAGDGVAADPGGVADPGADPGTMPGDQPASEPPAPAAPGNRPADEDRTGITADTVKIGVLVTQTGAINFRSSAQATKAYVDMINEQGGVNGRRIEVVLRDDGLDENKGRQAIEEMINAGVFSFVAFNAPLSEQSVLPVLERHNIPLVGAFAIPAHPLGWIFSGPYETYGKVGGRVLCEQGVTKPGLIYLSNESEDTDFVIRESWRLGLKETCGIDLDPANVYSVDVTNPDYTNIVTSLRFAGVDGIGTILEATNMIRLQQAMNRQAYKPTHVASPFGGDPAVLKDPNVGSSFEGISVLSDVEFLGSSVPMIQQYEQQVTRRFGGQAELNWAGQHGWLGTHVFVEVLRALGADPTREALIEAVNSLTDFATGMTVPLTITSDPNSHVRNNQCMKVGKVVGGKVQQTHDWTCPPLTIDRGGAA
jgi:branched-chain amino acid transport system substrate-binding protein